MTALPNPRDWLPVEALRGWLRETSIGIPDIKVDVVRSFLDEAIAVCFERGFDLARIGVPGPLLQVLTEIEAPMLVRGLYGKYRGFELYVQQDYPIASVLELGFTVG